jgi:hypothetical protein
MDLFHFISIEFKFLVIFEELFLGGALFPNIRNHVS